MADEEKGRTIEGGGYGGGNKFEADVELNLDDIDVNSDVENEYQALYFYYNYQSH